MLRKITEGVTLLNNNHQYFWITLFVGLAVGLLRAFNPTDLVSMAIGTALFLIGVLLAHVLFLFDDQIHAEARKRITVGEESDSIPTSGSPLRRGYMLLFLPILAVFMVTSTRAALGLGFFWGLSSIYWWDIQQFFTANQQRQRVQETYFDQFPPNSPIPTWISWGFLGYGLILTIVLLLVRDGL